MTINIFVLNGDLNGENRSDAFLFMSGILSEKNVLTFDPTQGVEGVCKDRICLHV